MGLKQKKKLTKNQRAHIAAVKYQDRYFSFLMRLEDKPKVGRLNESVAYKRRKRAEAADKLVRENVKSVAIALRRGPKVRQDMAEIDDELKRRLKNKLYPVPCKTCIWAGICAEAKTSCEEWRAFAANPRPALARSQIPDELLKDMKDD